MENFKVPKAPSKASNNETAVEFTGGNEHDKKDADLEKEKTSKRKECNLRADIWNEFTRFKDEKEALKARCKHCLHVFFADPSKNGTSSLRKHIDKVCKKKPRDDSKQTQLGLMKSDTGVNAISSWRYDPELCRKRLAEMVICDELPFKHVEGFGFQRFVASLNPRFIIPSRFTLQRDCYEIYLAEKDKLLKFLKNSKQRVCITTDTWTSVQQINYMCITVHYIDENWNLCKKLLSFATIESHRGLDLANTIEKIFRAWGIDKIFTITVDNASSNDVAIRHMKEEFGSKKGSVLGGEYMHMRCIAHIINLACIDGLKLQCAPTSVLRIREAVRYVRHSPARRSLFKECMRMEGDKSKVELTLDVKTRWNSTYFMLDAALRHEKVWKRFEKEDRFFSYEMKSENHNKVGVLEASDWDYVRKLHSFLEYFYEVTLKISGTKYVTSNVFYHEIIGLVTTLKKWIESDDVDISITAAKMKEKFVKYWGNPEKMNMLIFIAAVMDPRYKLKFVDFTMHFLHGDVQVAELMKRKTKESLYKLFDHYRDEMTPMSFDDGSSDCSSNTTSSSRSEISSSSSIAMIEIYQMFDGENGQSVKSDLDVYLEEVNVNIQQSFDIIQWWKGNAIRFPILSYMACDVLAMPISTVASESIFSTGGRVLDDFRSSLAPAMVEALLCCQDWLRGSFLPINKEEDLESQEKIAYEIAHGDIFSRTNEALPRISEIIDGGGGNEDDDNRDKIGQS